MQLFFTPTIDGVNIGIQLSSEAALENVLSWERPHRHIFIEFHYILDGEEIVVFQESGKQYSITAGKLIAIPPRQYHLPCFNDGKPLTRINFGFSVENDENNDAPLIKLFNSFSQPTVIESGFLSSSMDRLQTLLSGNGTMYSKKARAGAILLDLILDILYSAYSENASETKQLQNQIRQKELIDEYISTQYNAPEGLAGLARELYLSERQTRKLVNKFFGTDYKTLIIKERLDSAKMLLKTTAVPLEEIAQRIGYRSYSGFHLAFVRLFGETPGEYRKRIK